MGLLSGVLGFYMEFVCTNSGFWTWLNSGGGISGVPYIMIITYFMAGILAASLALCTKCNKFMNKNYDKISYLFLIPSGIIYTILTRDFTLSALVLAVFFYSKINKNLYFLQASAIIAVADVLIENALIYLGFITYTNGYSSAIYMGLFAGFLLIMSLTTFIANFKLKHI